METTVKQRLTEYIAFRNLDNAKFERLCGLGNGYVNKLKTEPGSKKLDCILRACPDLSKEWLLYGEGEMLHKNEENSKNNLTAQPQRSNLPATVEVKDNYIEVECPNCGEVIEVESGAVLPLVPPEVTRAPNIDLENFRHNRPQEMDEVDLRQVWGKGVFLVKIDTRVMEPEYREGSYLVLRKLPGLAYARPDGSAYVIDTMLPHTLFRYLSKERDGSYKLSANRASERDPLYLQAEDIQHVYDIVGSFRVGR